MDKRWDRICKISIINVPHLKSHLKDADADSLCSAVSASYSHFPLLSHIHYTISRRSAKPCTQSTLVFSITEIQGWAMTFPAADSGWNQDMFVLLRVTCHSEITLAITQSYCSHIEHVTPQQKQLTAALAQWPQSAVGDHPSLYVLLGKTQRVSKKCDLSYHMKKV